MSWAKSQRSLSVVVIALRYGWNPSVLIWNRYVQSPRELRHAEPVRALAVSGEAIHI